jgi:hypothetical protein
MRKWLVSRRWALGFLAWAALAFTIAYWDHDENRRLAGAPTAPAVVTDIIRWSKGGPYLELRIELPDGRTVQASTNQFYDVPQPRKGGRIIVQYAIDGRDVYAREAGLGPNHAGIWGWSTAGTGAGLTGIVLLVVTSRRSRRALGDQ